MWMAACERFIFMSAIIVIILTPIEWELVLYSNTKGSISAIIKGSSVETEIWLKYFLCVFPSVSNTWPLEFALSSM